VRAHTSTARLRDSIGLGAGRYVRRPDEEVLMGERVRHHESVKPSEQRGGTTPDADEAREKGQWAASAAEGIVPADLGGSDAPDDLLDEDPELTGDVLGVTTGSDEPATDEGIDLHAGDHADATSDGGPSVPAGVEPDLRDAAASQTRPEEVPPVSP
jgi:hypothetical protein